MHRVLVASALLILAACGSGTAETRDVIAGADQPMLPQETGKTLVYECDNYEFVVRTGPGEVALWLHDRYLVLGQVRAASGSRYEGDGVLLWFKGEDVLIEDNGRRHLGCRSIPARVPWEDARRRGVDYRASGNEPGWHLEIVDRQRLLYVGDYGSTRQLFDAPQRDDSEGLVVFTVPGSDVRVEFHDTPCRDTMRGDPFPLSVELTIDERQLNGCGMQLERPWE